MVFGFAGACINIFSVCVNVFGVYVCDCLCVFVHGLMLYYFSFHLPIYAIHVNLVGFELHSFH